jgi:anaerobic magnesium-protoporphyrin IX monomethyl ester cyclase
MAPWPSSVSRLIRRTAGRPSRLWLDLGDLGVLVHPGEPHPQWQDCTSWDQVRRRLRGYDVLIMNVRSYTYPMACAAARMFKELNPDGQVVAGGMHAAVALPEMTRVPDFDHICQGPGEQVIVDLVRDPRAFPRVISATGAKSMAEWPIIDRTLWPRPAGPLARTYPWPLEPDCGWGPPPVATVLTSRVCPWQCAFCNENSYIPNMGRRPVEAVIDELNHLDATHGPLGSVVIHDSMFFQNPSWLRQWLAAYPRRARKPWPYWAAARADTVRQWPELFEALVRETNWTTVSIGFESGSDRVLRILNKECTEEDNAFTIDLLNRIGDDLERQGKPAPRFWANIMLAIPGETREDAFRTMRMLRTMRRAVWCIAFYAPYPGSVLGHQLIAEGKSLMTSDRYHRFASDEKVKGVDYDFYRELLRGRYEAEIAAGMPPAR